MKTLNKHEHYLCALHHHPEWVCVWSRKARIHDYTRKVHHHDCCVEIPAKIFVAKNQKTRVVKIIIISVCVWAVAAAAATENKNKKSQKKSRYTIRNNGYISETFFLRKSLVYFSSSSHSPRYYNVSCRRLTMHARRVECMNKNYVSTSRNGRDNFFPVCMYFPHTVSREKCESVTIISNFCSFKRRTDRHDDNNLL